MGNESVECRDFESDYHPRVLRIPVERRPMILSLELRVEPRMTCKVRTNEVKTDGAPGISRPERTKDHIPCVAYVLWKTVEILRDMDQSATRHVRIDSASESSV